MKDNWSGGKMGTRTNRRLLQESKQEMTRSWIKSGKEEMIWPIAKKKKWSLNESHGRKHKGFKRGYGFRLIGEM